MNHPNASNESVRVDCAASAMFQTWLAEADGTIAVSTYQAGKVAMIGWDGRQVTLLMRDFDKPLGMAAEGKQLVLATRNDVCILANAPALAWEYREDQPGRYDALYLPRTTYHTGDLHTHDVAITDGEVILVNTRFSCLSRLGYDFSFTPLWKPEFVTDLVPEDRCHLNGLAMRDGRPRYVTALGTTDAPGGWREDKATGGVVIDVETDQIVADGMAMPHSPRWHQEKLWVLNSGAGELLAIDPDTGQRTEICRLPGYLRGLCFVGPYALVGLCKIREKHIFGGLPIQSRCEQLLCGVAVVDTRTGQEVGLFEYTSGCEEIYDVVFLPAVHRPMILNHQRPVVHQAITNPQSSYWLRPGAEAASESGQDGSRSQAPPASAGVAAADRQPMGNLLPDSGNSL